MSAHITIKKNDEPNLRKPKFNVDSELHKKLNDYEITRLMNRHTVSLFLGRAGSGKSTLLISMLQTPQLFKGVFHNIILFCPANSRASISNDFWAKNLPEEQIYDDLTMDSLAEAYQMAQENCGEGYRTLFVIDDLQSRLKGEVEKFFLHICNNRRHSQISIWLACQNYMSIPKQVRAGLTDLFVFKCGKTEMNHIMEEQVELSPDLFHEVLPLVHNKSHDFLYINTGARRIFSNWDELIINRE